MEHPDITKMNMYGYINEPNVVGQDFFKNEICKGDDIFQYEDLVFLVDELGYEAIEILKVIGAERKDA